MRMPGGVMGYLPDAIKCRVSEERKLTVIIFIDLLSIQVY